MILELDCGNTRIKWRLRAAEHCVARGHFKSSNGAEWFSSTDETTKIIWQSVPQKIWVSSVLSGEEKKRIAHWAFNEFGINPEFAASETECVGVVNGYQEPEKLGVDRWLAILAAKHLAQKSFIVMDCGSAVTLDLVTSSGEHLGGYIAPGLRMMRDALVGKTAAIRVDNIGYAENAFPGRNTVRAVKAAELAMYCGLILQAKGVLRNYDHDDPQIFLAGGDGNWLASHIENSLYCEDLVLDGLKYALAKSESSRSK